MNFQQILMAAAQGGGGAPGYSVNAADNSAAAFLARGAGLTGAANGHKFTVSFWFRLDGGDAATRQIFRSASGDFYCYRENDNKFHVGGSDGVTGNVKLVSSATYTAGATWRHFAAAVDANFTTGNRLHHMYIDGVDVKTLSQDNITYPGTFDFTTTNWFICAATATPHDLYDGAIAELYVNTAEYVDLSVAGNRAKFRSTGGKPVDLGADGSTPTGTAPIIYLKSVAASFGTNSGTGGDFTVNAGPFTTASSSPSD